MLFFILLLRHPTAIFHLVDAKIGFRLTGQSSDLIPYDSFVSKPICQNVW